MRETAPAGDEDREPREAKRTLSDGLKGIVTGVVILLVVGVIARALLSADERATGDIATGIQEWAEDASPRSRPVTVECPDPVEWRVGETFRCVVSQGKQSTLVTVTMENDDGYVTWQAG